MTRSALDIAVRPAQLTRKAATVPAWCAPRLGKRDNAIGPHLLLVDSAGANHEDLLAAWCVIGADRLGATAIIGDDQRSPALVGDMIAAALHEGPINAVIGHFSSPVARRAAQVYAKAGIPFFAPGSSADTLALDASNPVFQLFARDSGQIDAIVTALSGDRNIIALGETGNAGEALLSALHRRIGARLDTTLRSSDALAACNLRGRTVVILGSKEYAASALYHMARGFGPKAVLLSDDSLCAPEVENAATRISCPVRVTGLVDGRGETLPGGLDVKATEAEAEELLGRRPGPYFLTSCIAVTLAIRAYQAGFRTPLEMRDHLSGQRICSPYGRLTLAETGAFNGFTWTTRSMK